MGGDGMEVQDSLDWLHLVSERHMDVMPVAVLCAVPQTGGRLLAAALLCVPATRIGNETCSAQQRLAYNGLWLH